MDPGCSNPYCSRVKCTTYVSQSVTIACYLQNSSPNPYNIADTQYLPKNKNKKNGEFTSLDTNNCHETFQFYDNKVYDNMASIFLF